MEPFILVLHDKEQTFQANDIGTDAVADLKRDSALKNLSLVPDFYLVCIQCCWRVSVQEA